MKLLQMSFITVGVTLGIVSSFASVDRSVKVGDSVRFKPSNPSHIQFNGCLSRKVVDDFQNGIVKVSLVECPFDGGVLTSVTVQKTDLEKL